VKIPEHMLLYTDSDHCGEEEQRSTSGWTVLLRGYLVVWGSKLQATAVESTCAAEFVTACMGENACMKLRDLLFESPVRMSLQSCWLLIRALWGSSVDLLGGTCGLIRSVELCTNARWRSSSGLVTSQQQSKWQIFHKKSEYCHF
jgi:hypothetical protein